MQYKEIELSQNNIGDGEELCMGDGVSNPLSSAAPAEPSNQAPSIRRGQARRLGTPPRERGRRAKRVLVVV